MKGLRMAGALVWKDLLIDLRRKENILSMFFFALLTLIIFRFALGGEEAASYRVTALVLQTPAVQALAVEQQDQVAALLGRTYPERATLLEALRPLAAEVSPQARLAIAEAARRTPARESAPGLLWVTLLFAGILGLSKSFAQEQENGCMGGLLLTPLPRTQLFFGKMLSNAAFLALILCVLVPLYGLLLGVALAQVWPSLVLVLAGGVLGFTALGTLLGGLVATLKGREVLLPLLLFPLLAPLLLVAVRLTEVVLSGGSLAAERDWWLLLLACDGIFLVASWLTFEVVVES